MGLADCDRVAEIRVRGRQSAYRGLMPQAHLDAMDPAADAERRRALFGRAPGGVANLVAEDDGGEVVGWACRGPYRDGEARTADAELYAIHVDAGRFGAGVGQALLRESVRRCESAGYPRMLLWGCSGATPAPGASTSGRGSARTAPRSRPWWTGPRCRRCGTRVRWAADDRSPERRRPGAPRSASRGRPAPAHRCPGMRASARTAASASAGWARASFRTGAARSSPRVPSPSTQASATRR